MSSYEDEDLISVADLQIMLGRARVPKKGEATSTEPVSRTYAQQISQRRGFPAPVIDLPNKIRLWRRSDVEKWLDKNRPWWRNNPPAGEKDAGTSRTPEPS